MRREGKIAKRAAVDQNEGGLFERAGRGDKEAVDLSIIIVNYRSSPLLAGCLRSLRGCAEDVDREILVYDNGPDDPGLGAVLRTAPEVRLVAGERGVSFGAANNACAAASSGEYLLFLNPDTAARPGSVEGLLRFVRSDCHRAVAGPRLTDGAGRLEISAAPDPCLFSEAWIRAAKRLPVPLRSLACRRGRPRRADWVTGAAMMVRRDAFEKAGGFDEAFPLYFEDADLCRRIRLAGGEVWYVPESEMVHLGGATGAGGGGGRDESRERKQRTGQIRYYMKHRRRWELRVLVRYLRGKYGDRPGWSDFLSSFGSE